MNLVVKVLEISASHPAPLALLRLPLFWHVDAECTSSSPRRPVVPPRPQSLEQETEWIKTALMMAVRPKLAESEM